MRSPQLTGSITAAANIMAKGLTLEELNLIGMVFTLLGDTLITIASQRALQESLDVSNTCEKRRNVLP